MRYSKHGESRSANAIPMFVLDPAVPAHLVEIGAGDLQRIPFSGKVSNFRIAIPAGADVSLVFGWSRTGANPDTVALDGTSSQLVGSFPLPPGVSEWAIDSADGYDTYLSSAAAVAVYVVEAAGA
jgi:hypothetical protein